jgi:predicted flap endonuclease-1-like 5' DNA nuclease
MYLIGQAIVYLALALIIGGALGYALRSCIADTACDDVREDLALAQSRYDAILKTQSAIPPQQMTIVATVASSAPSLVDMDARALEAALLSAAPGTSLKNRFGADDLTAIQGITPKMDVWLGLQGITRFAQIANLSAGELFWLVENLPEHGGSVYRDQWVAQATKLITTKS